MKYLFPFILAIFFISSCKQEDRTVVSHSPDNKIQLTVSAKRDTRLNPWNVNLVATGNGLNGNVNFEFYGSEVSDKTISFVWDKSKTCTITFTERDNTKRIFEFTPHSTEIMWKDLSVK